MAHVRTCSGGTGARDGNGIIQLVMTKALAHPNPTLRERLLRPVAQTLDKPEAAASLPLDRRLADLGMSSIRMVTLMLAAEAEFGVSIPQGEITPENFRTVASVEALLEKLLARAA